MINEDYAGGSYKTNAELESDVEDLQAKVSGCMDKITELEADLDKLKNLINKMVTVDESQETPYTSREIVQVLFSWANGDN